jgi:hypothetical protein
MKRLMLGLFSMTFLCTAPIHTMDDGACCDLKTVQVLEDTDEPFVFNKELTSLNTLISHYGHNSDHAFKDVMVFLLFKQKFMRAGTIEEQRGDYAILKEAFPLLLIAYKKIKNTMHYALLLKTNTILESERLKGILLYNQDIGEQKNIKTSPEKRSYPSSPNSKSPQKSPLVPASLASSHENMRPRHKENRSPLPFSSLERSHTYCPEPESDNSDSEKSSIDCDLVVQGSLCSSRTVRPSFQICQAI